MIDVEIKSARSTSSAAGPDADAEALRGTMHANSSTSKENATSLRNELERSQERLNLLLRASADGFWDWNGETGEIFVSPRCFEMFGYEHENPTPCWRTLEAISDPDHLPRFIETLRAFLDGPTDSDLRVEHRIRNRSGTWQSVVIRASVAARDEQGRARRVAGTVTDVSRRKAAEEELREHRDLLDELVAQRTFELAEANARLQSDIARRKEAEARLQETNAELTDALTRERQTAVQLESAMRQAESANRAKSEFLANMSHEIRTPMNGIIGMTQLTLKTELTDDQRDCLSTVIECANALLELIEDILDFSKIEAGKLQLEYTPFRPMAVLQAVADLHKHRAAENGLELVCHADSELPQRVVGDPVRLRQVLINLVGNAIKFTHQGEVELRAGLERQSGSTTTIRFSVRDTGIGIPIEQQALIFERFTQADGSTTRKYGGTGLGLAICRQLVELMGGRIELQSDVGRGSTFHFAVPFELAAAHDDEDSSTVASTIDPVSLLRDVRTIIVDDNATNRRVVGELIATWGCRAAVAGSGQDALDALRAATAEGRPFDLVVLDVQMPQMDGLAVERTIRTDPAYGQPAVVFLSSCGSMIDRTELARSSRAKYLCKPVKQLELLQALFELLHPSAAQDENPQRPANRADATDDPKKTKRRILLVEDNAINRKVALGILSTFPYDVVVAENGRMALERLNASSFDLVLMDVQMDEMDGLETARCIRMEDRWRDLPIVALTANSSPQDQRECHDAGMNDCISKPVDAVALCDSVDTWLHREPASKYEPSAPSRPSAELNLGMSKEAPLDRDRAIKRLGGDAELFDEVVQAFVEDAPQWIREMQDAAAKREIPRMRNAAHTLKGASSNIGATCLHRLAKAIEHMAKTDTLRDVDARLAELQAQFDRLREYAGSMRSG